MPKEGEKPTESSAAEAKLQGVEFILRENERLKKELRGYKGRAAAEKRKEVPTEQEKTETKPEQAVPKHFVHSGDKFCPDCGEPNPLFIDETRCGKRDGTGGCGRPLGAVAEVAKMRACPDCGSTNFHATRALTKEEEALFVK